jgi:hypothetical protein
MKQFCPGDGSCISNQLLCNSSEPAAWMHQSPLKWKDLDMMSHDEFVKGYEKGSLGCSVSVLLTIRLFLAGKIRDKKILINLLIWSFALLLLISASVIEFLKIPFTWGLLCTAISLAFYAIAFFYSLGEVVLSIALLKEDFYKLAMAERAIWIFPDDEKNLPKLERAVLIRHARRARR